MLRNPRAVLTTWQFVTALLLLLLNDLWLKRVFPGHLTGKLSDFAGIAVVGLILFASLPRHRLKAGMTIGILFALWKSPISQPAIDALNLALTRPIGRQVDYTDLLALLILPACASGAARCIVDVRAHHARRLLAWPLLGLTAFAVSATTLLPIRQGFALNVPVTASELDRARTLRVIGDIAKRHGLACRSCLLESDEGQYGGRGLELSYTFKDDRSVAFEIDAGSAAMVGPKESKRANRLRDDLRTALTSELVGAEFLQIYDTNPASVR